MNIDLLRVLIEEWRELARVHRGFDDVIAEAYDACADQLEEALL